MTGSSAVIMGTLATKVPFQQEIWDQPLCPHFGPEAGVWQSEAEGSEEYAED